MHLPEDLTEEQVSLSTGIEPKPISSDLLKKLRERSDSDFYFFCYGILGFTDMTLSCHGPMCSFITNTKWKRKINLQPRGCLKTTICTIGHSLWIASKDSGASILIANEIEPNAVEMLTKIADIILHNPLYRAVYQDRLPDSITRDNTLRWNDHQRDLARPKGVMRHGPTFTAMGTKGSPTSRHFTHIKYDDIYGEKASDSEADADRVYSFFAKADSLLVSPRENYIDLIGTHWHPQDLYTRVIERSGAVMLDQSGQEFTTVGEKPRYLVWKRKCWDEDRNPIWPERFPQDHLEDLEREDVYWFSLQYLNDPINPDIVDFDIADLRYYDFAQDGDTFLLQGIKDPVFAEDCDRIGILDPAVGIDKTQRSKIAIVILFAAPNGTIIVRESWSKKCRKTTHDPANPGWLDQMYIFQQRFDLRVFLIEAVGFQGTIGRDDIYERNFKEAHPINWVDIKLGGRGAKRKPIRNRNVLQPVLATNRLYLRRTMTSLIDDLRKHPMGMGSRTMTYDETDCLAHGIPKLSFPFTGKHREREIHKERVARAQLGAVTGYGIPYA